MPKVFKNKRGGVYGSTLTVKELKEALSNYPDDMPVMATWEGVTAWIEEDLFEVENIYKDNPEETFDCLLIYVGSY